MTFDEWWSSKGARTYCETHEDRARMAWEAALHGPILNTPITADMLIQLYQQDLGRIGKAKLIDGKWTLIQRE